MTASNYRSNIYLLKQWDCFAHFPLNLHIMCRRHFDHTSSIFSNFHLNVNTQERDQLWNLLSPPQQKDLRKLFSICSFTYKTNLFQQISIPFIDFSNINTDAGRSIFLKQLTFDLEKHWKLASIIIYVLACQVSDIHCQICTVPPAWTPSKCKSSLWLYLEYKMKQEFHKSQFSPLICSIMKPFNTCKIL